MSNHLVSSFPLFIDHFVADVAFLIADVKSTCSDDEGVFLDNNNNGNNNNHINNLENVNMATQNQCIGDQLKNEDEITDQNENITMVVLNNGDPEGIENKSKRAQNQHQINERVVLGDINNGRMSGTPRICLEGGREKE